MTKRREPVGVEKVGSLRLPQGPSFLTLERMQVRTLYADGSRSSAYPIDCLHRRGVDAVAVLLYDAGSGPLRIGLRRALRPILSFRTELPLPLEEPDLPTLVWEAVAGSLEPEDRGEEGLRRRVVEEVWEEAGFRIRPEAVEDLGAGFFPSHGQSSEKVHLRAVSVQEEDPDRGPGRGTGPSEEGWTEFLEAGRVVEMCRRGEILDPKVEIGVRRLLERESGMGSARERV